MDASIIALIVALAGAIPGVLAYFAQKKLNKELAKKASAETGKTSAEAADIISDSAMALLIPLKAEVKECKDEAIALRAEVQKLREEVSCVRHENDLLRDWAKRLALQVIQCGGIPIPEPDMPKNVKTKPIG
jgi:hypothetical protein